MTKTTTHIAGVVVRIGSRVIQRCALCGDKLIDNDMAGAEVPEDQVNTPFPAWEVEALVRVDGNMYEAIEARPDHKLPPDSCLALLEAP